MSTLKVDTILKRSGTGTITLGQSGDTLSIPAGANATLGGSGSTITIPSGSTIANSGTATGFAPVGISSSMTSGTGLTVDADGHVTKPLNTAFRVYQSSPTDYANGHTMYNQNITEVYDVNSDMATNGTFTAPVTGKYLISVSAYDAAATEETGYDMILTTSNRTYRWGNRMEYRDNYTGYTNAKMEGTLIVDMDASDTCTVTCGATTTITNASNQEHSYFSGILIG